MPCPLLTFSQSDYLIQIVDTNSHSKWQTMQIQISCQLIWIYSVCKGRVYPGPGLRNNYNIFIRSLSQQSSARLYNIPSQRPLAQQTHKVMTSQWCQNNVITTLCVYWVTCSKYKTLPTVNPYDEQHGKKALTLRKQAYTNIWKTSPPKTESFQIKILIFFTFLLKT